eukprot:SAG22_NODE_7356_length_748_cov_0.930663_1_plen_180_part_01
MKALICCSCPSARRLLWISVITPLYLLFLGHVLDTRLLFVRPGTESCVPADELGRGAAAASREISEDEVLRFHRDGGVVLRGIIPPVWTGRLHGLVRDVFEHPNLWDVIYSVRGRRFVQFRLEVADFLVSASWSCPATGWPTCGPRTAAAASTPRLRAPDALLAVVLRPCVVLASLAAAL